MTLAVLVDEARWWWRGRRWAHLASDHSLAELHRFAAGAGLHRVSFGGDHYDVTEAQRLEVIAAGAEPVGTRELVRRLHRSGLRRAAGSGSHRWEWLADNVWDPAAPAGDGPGDRLAAATGWMPPPAVATYLAEVVARWADRPVGVRVLQRPPELALLVADPGGRSDAAVAALTLPPAPEGVTGSWITVPAPSRLLELFIRADDLPIPTTTTTGPAPPG